MQEANAGLLPAVFAGFNHVGVDQTCGKKTDTWERKNPTADSLSDCSDRLSAGVGQPEIQK